jgi:hypothetical protein
MKSKTVFVCLVAVAVAFVMLFYDAAGAQEKKTAVEKEIMVKRKVKHIEDIAQKSRGEGKDENIKTETLKNNPNATIPAPPEKGGEKGRGAYCFLGVDNRTKWIIRIYVDGTNVGAVSSWGDATGTYDRGTHQFYAVAYFDDGSRLTWGPRTVNCDGPYTWTLNP